MRNQTSEAFAYIEREYMTARGTKEAMRFEDDLRRIDEHIAEARRLVQRQKGLIIRSRAAGVSTWDAQRILWLLEAKSSPIEEHGDRLRESIK